MYKKDRAIRDKTKTPIEFIKKTFTTYKTGFLIFIITLLITFPYRSEHIIERYPNIGEVSTETVIAPFNFDITKEEDLILKEQLAAETKILPIFNYSDKNRAKSIKRIDTVTQSIFKLSNIEKSLELSYKKYQKTISALSDSLEVPIYTIDSTLLKNKKEIIVYLNTVLTLEDITFLKEHLNILENWQAQLKDYVNRGILSRVIVSSFKDVERLEKNNSFATYGGGIDYHFSNSNFLTLVNRDSASNTVAIDSVNTIITLFSLLSNNTKVSKSQKALLMSSLYHIIDATIEPNYIYNGNLTDSLKKDAISKVNPIKKTIIQDVEIVRKHQIVTEEISEILTSLEHEREKLSKSTQNQLYMNFVSGITILLVIGIALLLLLYMTDVKPTGVSKQLFFTSVSVMIAVQLFIIRGGIILVSKFSEQLTIQSSTIEFSGIPMTVATLTAAILFNKQTGFYISIFISAYIGVVTDFNLVATIETLIVGGLAAYLGTSIRYRKDFIRLLFWLMVVNSIIIVMAVIADHNITNHKIIYGLVYAVTDAIISVLIVNLILPIIEEQFDLTTDMTLIELADMNHPILKTLSISAPGTYNHSILVANLAESAAKEIGANALLCRVASYYHDIGKTKKAVNFIENQRFRKNPHDSMPATRSVRVIMSHVKDGITLAKEYKLPKIIVDAIDQHHGDALMGYFYNKALDENRDNEKIDKHTFSYSGSKPQTKEMAIIMIADSLEAASRTLKSTTTIKLRELAKKLVRDKIFTGQLDECSLTFNETTKIINGFMPVLEGIFHSRIEYPEQKNEV